MHLYSRGPNGHWLNRGAILLGALLLASCSSSKKAQDGDVYEGDGVGEYGDAGTDVVPIDGAETPQEKDPLAGMDQPPEGGAAVDPYAAPSSTPGESSDPYAGTTEDPNGGTFEPQATSEYPSGTSTPVQGGTGRDSYVFRPGDTLMKVAFEVYGDLYQWRRIYDLNRDVISDPNRIPSGITLKLDAPASAPRISRNGEAYRIREGDTLGSISGRVYGTRARWREIWDNNRELIKDPNRIYAGFTLYYLPDGGAGLMGSTGQSKVTPFRQPASAETAEPAASMDVKN